MSDVISTRIQFITDQRGIDAATRAVQQFAATATKTGGAAVAQASKQTAAGITQTGQAAQRAQSQILSLAQAQSRLLATQGQNAAAFNTLNAAISQSSAGALQLTRAKTQLAQIQNKLSGQTQSLTTLFSGQNSVIAGLGQQFSQLGGSVGGLSGSIGALAGSMGTLGAVGAAIGVGKVAIDLAVVGSNAALVKQRFDGLAESAGTTGDALLGALRAASAGEISDLNLQLAANRAQLLGVADSAQEFSVLMEIARDRAQQMGISTTQAFNDLVTGLGRGSALILDNLGITVSVAEANEQYAASLGKTAQQLTEAEQKQALINAVLTQGKASLEATGGAAETTAGQIAQGQAAFENLKNSLGGLVAIKLGPVAEDIGAVVNAFAGAGDIGSALAGFADLSVQINPQIDLFRNLISVVDETGGALGRLAGIEIPDNFSPLRDSVNQWLEVLGLAPTAEAEVANAAQATADTMESARAREAAATNMAADTMEAYRAIQVTATANTQMAAQAQLQYATSMEMTGVQARAAQMAAEQKANADQVAAVDAQTHAVAQQQLTAAAQSAAQALLAAGPAGANTAAMLAGSSSQVDVLTAAYYRLLAAQQAVGVAAQKTKARKENFEERHGGMGGADLTPAARARAAQEQKLNQQIADAKKASDAAAARNEQVLATGTHQQKLALLQQEYQTAVKQHGAESAEAIKAQTKLMQEQDRAAKGGGGGGGGRVSAAQTAGAKLGQIEQKTGDKIAEIDQNTQDKLIEIDRRAAEERARIAADLANKIATTQADMRAQQEADDLELIGVTDEKEAQRLNDRETAQAAAREREAAAAKEAQDSIAAGEAESASKVYDIRQKQISDQQQLDEQYAERQRELAGNEEALAALKTQYDEATRAINEAAETRIAIAKAESEQKKAAVQAEKDAVIAAAEEQKNQVVSKAQQSAQGVMKASAEARAKSVADLQAIGKAVDAIPTSKTITITTKQEGSTGGESASGGGGGGTKAAGGGTFVTRGRTTLTVGDNPGGRELVSVTPLSGRGQTRVGGGMIALAGGGQVVVDAGGGYTTPIAGGTPTKPAKGKGKGKGGKNDAPVDAKKALDEMKNTVQLLMDMARLKEQIAKLAGVPAFDIPTVQALVNRAQEFTTFVMGHLVPITKKEGESLDAYFKAAQGAANLIGDMAELKKDIAELKDVPAFDQPTVLALIDRAEQFTRAVGARLVPLTEFESELFSRYASAVSDSVGIIKDVADLKKDMAEAASSPLDLQAVIRLADDAARITEIVKGRVLARTEEEVDALGLYADAVGSSVGLLKDVSGLTKDMFTDYQSPSDAQITMLANDAYRVSRGMMNAASTYSKEGLEAGKTYAESVGATFSAFKDGLLFFDALKSGDFRLDAAALGQFEKATVDTMEVARRLGAVAATIPTSDIAALQTTTAALAAQSEALIKLAAVPFGDLPGATAGLAAQRGQLIGGGSVTNYITINPPVGSSPQQIADMVISRMNSAVGARR